MTCRMLLLCLAAFAAATTAAQAATVSAVPGLVTYRADPGEASFVTVD